MLTLSEVNSTQPSRLQKRLSNICALLLFGGVNIAEEKKTEEEKFTTRNRTVPLLENDSLTLCSISELQLWDMGMVELLKQIGCKVNLYFCYSTSYWHVGTTKLQSQTHRQT